jgi:hypothetical protein
MPPSNSQSYVDLTQDESGAQAPIAQTAVKTLSPFRRLDREVVKVQFQLVEVMNLIEKQTNHVDSLEKQIRDLQYGLHEKISDVQEKVWALLQQQKVWALLQQQKPASDSTEIAAGESTTEAKSVSVEVLTMPVETGNKELHHTADMTGAVCDKTQSVGCKTEADASDATTASVDHRQNEPDTAQSGADASKTSPARVDLTSDQDEAQNMPTGADKAGVQNEAKSIAEPAAAGSPHPTNDLGSAEVDYRSAGSRKRRGQEPVESTKKRSRRQL